MVTMRSSHLHFILSVPGQFFFHFFAVLEQTQLTPSRAPQLLCFSATSIMNQINSSPLQSNLCYFCQRNTKRTKVQVKNQSFSRANSTSQSRGRCPRRNSDNGAWHRGTGFFVFPSTGGAEAEDFHKLKVSLAYRPSLGQPGLHSETQTQQS